MNGDDTPADHDPGNPDPRPDLLEDHIAGDLEQEVADEEDAGAEAVDRIAEVEVDSHPQLGEADVDSVQVGRDVAEEQQGDQAPSNPAVDCCFDERRAH